MYKNTRSDARGVFVFDDKLRVRFTNEPFGVRFRIRQSKGKLKETLGAARARRMRPRGVLHIALSETSCWRR
ncbi:MAG: hypothetical protein ACLRSW_05660 [Christensenellaceae bacterium]